MGQFNDKLLKALEYTVDPQGNNSMEVYGKLGGLGFDVDGLFDIKQFHNAVFKILMLRARDAYKNIGQGKLPPRDRHVSVSITLDLRSPTFHSDEELVEHGVATDLEDARGLRDVIPVIPSLPGDDATIDEILELINSGQISLACF